MGSSLKTYTVEELVNLGALEKPLDGNHGGIHPKSSEFVAEGIPFIMASDMKNGKIDTRNCKFISEDQARGLRKGFAKEGDVLLSHKATIGRTAIVDNIDTAFIVLTPQVTYYRVKNLGVINPKYLKYYFDSVQFQSLFEQWAGGGSTRLYLGITGQMKLPIELPDIETQNSIASIISDYDLKLLLNRQTNQTLEQMAQALFKSWFVDFDPVFDNLLASVDFKLENLETSLPDELKQKAQRRLAALDSLENVAQCKASLIALAHELQAQTQAAEQVSETPVKPNFNANPKILAQHANTHAHFTNEFEHSEQLGWIPKGWKQKYLSDLLEVKYGKDHKKLDDGKYPVYGSGGLMRSAESFLYDGESVLIPRKGTLSNIMHINGSFWTVDTMFYTIPKVPKVAKFMFYHLKALDFAAMNVGSAVPSMTTKVLNSLELLFPSVEVLYKFDRVIEDYFNKIDFNKLNINQLESLRNTLLPKLISGELQIPNVAIDEEVVD
ncbi:restriction endonuclease subunit S [Pseudoalteromonas fuliginea]|uniref:Type I restriction modification DNA specificity domain-containing protein n=1 Tax=Pseudoalteromonas fuliginea TaxID=1872678 RepID=A0ABD3YCU6_9GAMM|nr:restriction endonuclease subunit S [Pseudoalteromonas fuliginea]KDC52573.1 hypothetical protein DC53_04380 [Pseudoalteromonas fuliginea]